MPHRHIYSVLKQISHKAQEALSHFIIWISELNVARKNMQDLTYHNLYILYGTYQSIKQ